MPLRKRPSGILLADAEDCGRCRFRYLDYEGGGYSVQCGLWGREILTSQEHNRWVSEMNKITPPGWCVLPIEVQRKDPE
jgi:hypothetical protein